MKNKHLLRLFVVGCAVLILSLFFLTRPSYAIDLTPIIDKYNLSQIAKCYQDSHMVTAIKYGDLINGLNIVSGNTMSFGDIVQQSYSNYSILQMDTTLAVNGVDDTMACANVLSEKYPNLVPKGDNPSEAAVDNFMTSMGYTIEKSAGKCITVELHSDFYSDSVGKLNIQQVCDDGSGNLTVSNSGNRSQAPWLEVNNGQVVVYKSSWNKEVVPYSSNIDTFANSFYAAIANIIKDSKYWYATETTQAGEKPYTISDSNALQKTYKLSSNALSMALSTLSNGTYKSIGDLKLTSDELSRFYVEAILNEYYQTKSYGNNSSIMQCATVTGEDNINAAKAAGYIQYRKTHNAYGPSCYVQATRNEKRTLPVGLTNGEFNGRELTYAQIVSLASDLAADAQWEVKKECKQKYDSKARQYRDTINNAPKDSPAYKEAEEKLKELQALLNGKDPSDVYSYSVQDENGAITCIVDTESSYTPPTEDLSTPSDNENTPGNTDQPMCYQAAKTLGWILCPVIEGIGGATRGIYQAFIEPFLNISSDFLQTGNSVEDGWSNFRNFANTLFAIAFVIVILAQITGIGISNYNIKKILPRLIMVVVLVNLSFIICQLAVDVSNILGSGLYNLFINLAGGVEAAGGSYGLGGIITTLLGTLGIAAAGVGAFVVARETWELWLIPFLLALVGCIIGVIFFFIVLAVRQAGIIVLIVLSPVAIVCYALPNTKTFFDRWRKMLTSLLVVYPICGVLLGGGLYVSKMLVESAGSDNVFFMLAAMLVQVVPFFMIPSIVRSSMTAMGNLGNKIAGFGQRLGGNLQRGIRSSAPVQDWQRSLDMHNAARSYNRAQRSIDRQGGDKKASRSALRRRSRAATRYNRLAYEDIRAGGGAQLLSEDNPAYNALVESESEKQRQENVNGYQTLITNNAMGSAAASGNVNGSSEDELSAELDHYIDETMGGIKSGKSVAELRDNINRAQAYINALSAKGTGSARAKVIQSLSKMMQGYSSDLQNSAYKDRLSSTINTLGAHTLDKYGADYKKDGPGNARMLSDIAAGKYTADNTNFAMVRDSNGKTHLHSEYYSKQGITGASAADFSKMKNRNVSDLLRTLSSGHIDGDEVLAAARLSDSVLSDPNAYQPDTDAIDPMSDVRLAAYGSQVAGTKTGRSAGSQAIGIATTNGLRAIAEKIQTAGDWSSMSADDQKYYGGLMSNIHQALQNETFSQADANILHSAAEAAQAKGFQVTTSGSSGSTTVAPVDAKDFTARNIKVGTSAQRRLETDLTAGGTYKIDRKKMRQGNIEDAVTRTDGAAMSDDDFDFIYKAQAHNAEVQRWNTENGFGPTPPTPGSSGSAGSP